MAETYKTAKRQVFTIITNIPRGKVATYGQIAKIAGIPSHARLVGRILSQLPAKTSLPWHRIVNSRGRITNPDKQRQTNKLAEEGVTLINDRINLKLYGWYPL